MIATSDGGGRIARIRLHPVLHHVPDAHAYAMARGLTAVRGATIVEVETRDGITGFSEACGPPEFVAGVPQARMAGRPNRQ